MVFPCKVTHYFPKSGTLFFWKFQKERFLKRFLTITGDWLRLPQTRLGIAQASLALLSLLLRFLTTDTVRSRTTRWHCDSPASLFLVVSNCHEWPAISMKYYFYNFKKKYSWKIPDYYWRFLTTETVRLWTCGHGMVSQAKRFCVVRNGQEWSGICQKSVFWKFQFSDDKKNNIAGVLLK